MAEPNVSPRAVAAYLIALRKVVADATESRRAFVHGFGPLVEGGRRGDAAASARAAAKLGREHMGAFASRQERLSALQPPRSCAACHEAVQGWLGKHVAACEAMIAAGASGDLGRMQEAHGLLGEARLFARRFNAEYEAVVASLRRAVVGARRR